MRQTWQGTYDASLDLWFSAYPNTATQADGAEIMIWLSHPHVRHRGRRPARLDLPTGGSIGYALPCAAGAAIACPGRKVIALRRWRRSAPPPPTSSPAGCGPASPSRGRPGRGGALAAAGDARLVRRHLMIGPGRARAGG